LAVLGVLALLLGTVSTGLSSPLLGLSFSLPKSSPPSPPPLPVPGDLLVKASVYQAGNGTDPVAGATVSIGSGVVGVASLLTSTNSSGEAQVSLLPGNYTIRVYNGGFTTFADFSIVSSRTTFANVSAVRSETQPVFSDLSDQDSSGFVGPWQQISLAVNSSSAKLILTSSAIFLDAVYPRGSVGASLSQGNVTKEVSALIVSEPATPSAPGPLWFTLQPSSFISVTGLSDLAIGTYSASITVNILEP